MTLKDIIAKDQELFFNINEFAEPAQYNGADILVIPEIGEGHVKGNIFSEKGSSDRAFFWLKQAEVNNPAPPDIITHNGKDWQIARLVETDGVIHRVECTAMESVW